MGRGTAEWLTDRVATATAEVRAAAGACDPDALTSGEARAVQAAVADLRKAADGLQVVLARVHAKAGDRRQAAKDLAAANGTSTAEAQTLLDTAERTAAQPEVDAAMRRGDLSAAQADAVSDAADADPSATQAMLGAAATEGLSALNRRRRDTKAKADPSPEQTRRRHHHRRRFRSWTASDGEWYAELRGPGDLGARIDAALAGATQERFEAARAAGRHEDVAAYRFDALVDVLTPHARSTASPVEAPSVPPMPPRWAGRRDTQVIVRIDGAALMRGHAESGEACEIVGIGRTTVEAVRGLIHDAHVSYVIENGVDVSVVHLQRAPTAHQVTALAARGMCCEVPGCTAERLLEIDHVQDWAITHQTAVALLAWLCSFHHDQKSRGTHRLSGSPGRRRWLRADGTLLAADPDPPAQAA